AMVEQYLSNLEKRTEAVRGPDSAETTDKADSASNRWAPPDIDAGVPRVLSNSSSCPLPQILKQASSHTLDLIENMRRFSASEQIEQIEIDRNGKRQKSSRMEKMARLFCPSAPRSAERPPRRSAKFSALGTLIISRGVLGL